MTGFRPLTETRVVKVTLKGVPDRPGMAAEIFSALAERGINVELITAASGGDGLSDVSFVVRQDDLGNVLEKLKDMRAALGAESFKHDPNVALVSLDVAELVQTPGTAARMFACLSGRGINLDMISTSMASITCVIPENRVEDAVKALEDEFGRS